MPTDSSHMNIARRQELRLLDAIRGIRDRYPDDPRYAAELIAPYKTMLLQIRGEIDGALGFTTFQGADLELKVESEEIGLSGTPSSVLTETLDKLRKALAGSYARVMRTHWSGRGRHTEEVRKATDVRVLGMAPGSLRLAIDLPEAFHRRPLENYEPGASVSELAPAARALDYLFAAAEWAGSEEPVSALRENIPNDIDRKSILEQVRRLSPSPRGKISSISIAGVGFYAGRSALLTPASRDKARQGAYPSSVTVEFEDTGVLNAINFDRDREQRIFVLRKRPENKPEIRGDFSEELEEAVLDATKLKHRVRAKGILERTKGPKPKETLHLEEVERSQEQ